MGHIQYRSDSRAMSSPFVGELIEILWPYARARGDERVEWYRQKIRDRDYTFEPEAWLQRDLAIAQDELHHGGALRLRWMAEGKSGELDVSSPRDEGLLRDLQFLDSGANVTLTLVCGTNAFDYPSVNLQYNQSGTLVSISADDASFDSLVASIRKLVS